MAQSRERSSCETEVSPKHLAFGLSNLDVQNLYSQMVLTRALDERLWALNRQGRVALVASCQGAEAASMGSALAALKDGDYSKTSRGNQQHHCHSLYDERVPLIRSPNPGWTRSRDVSPNSENEVGSN